MKDTSKNFLEKLFNPGEEISVSPNEFAYKSIPVDMFGGKMSLISQGKYENTYEVDEEDIILCCINPVKGEKNDLNCTGLRTFLIEIDDGDIYEQKQYIDSLKMPYTACIFSGNKSLHYGITLSEDLTTLELWRDINEWILAIVSRADQQNKNPTKSIRFPGNMRKNGKALRQSLVDLKDRVDLDVLLDWLDRWPDLNPRIKKALRRRRTTSAIEVGDSVKIPKWMGDKLNEGVGRIGSRNKEWFQLSMELAKRGSSAEEIIACLGPHFTPEHDFTLREWSIIINSAVKRVERGIYDES